jgi:hypothetical protein
MEIQVNATVERRAAIEKTRGMFAHLAPGVSLADELIADRHKEARAEDAEGSNSRGTIQAMTAKEKLLQQAPQWNDAQATAALRVVEAHDELASYLDKETSSADEDEDSWATANAREAIREERW